MNVYEYDPILDSWQRKTNMPTARWGAGACTVGGNIYVIGGASGNNTRLNVVEEYYPDLDVTDVKEPDDINGMPTKYNLNQNFPNPFNPTTTISYSIPKECFVIVKVYDLLGREVKSLVNEEKIAGNYSVQFNGNSLVSGIYFYKLQAGNFIQTKKMVLLK